MYVFQAHTFCDSCGERIRANLAASGHAPVDVSDEYSFDSDDYPKGPYPLEATDSPNHCACGVDCLEPVVLSDGSRIGALLSDGLTAGGVNRLVGMLEHAGGFYYLADSYRSALHAYWREVFADELASVQA